MSAAIITGDISPLMIRRISDSISSWKISRCSMMRCRASVRGHRSLAVKWSSRGHRRQGSSQQRVAVLGQDRLGVELHALDRQRLVAHAHDLAVVGPGGDSRHRAATRARWPASGSASPSSGFGSPGRRRAVVVRPARSCRASALRAHDLAAERRADRLVPEADAEDRQLAGEIADRRHRDAGLGRRARPGRDDQRSGASAAIWRA